MTPDLGIIEGYYGKVWSPEDRLATIAALAPHGYRFFIHAPKADAFLRRRWREPHPAEALVVLEQLAARCAELGVSFGVGLSPYEIYRDFDGEAQAALSRKLAELEGIGAREIAILFDDMRGDLPDLARRQAQIMEFIADRTSADRLILCPTYYSDDAVLDRVFGARPEGYLASLAERLDPAVEVFWTGPEVCSREYSAGHLASAAERLGRPVTLWDNYPVNDGPMMSEFLHLRAFTGRGGVGVEHVKRHAINPANQSVLSRIPAITLAEAYASGSAYDYGEAWRRAAETVLGAELAALVERHLYLFQQTGLSRLGDAGPRLRERYADIDHPAAREIVAWLDGAYRVTAAEVAAA